MNSELQSYYHFSSPQRVLDKQIRPIIQHLHDSNINSLHQLKARLQQIASEHQQGNFSKTLPVFVPPIKTLTKFYSQKEGNSRKRSQISTTKRNSFTLSPTPKSLDTRERVHIISPISKVKRHLIENINLEEMKEALFKERKTPNRFQQFCDFIKEKERKQSNKSPKKTTKEVRSSIPSEEELRSIEKMDELNERFRITTRRKFWKQIRTTQSGDESSTEMLNIKGLVKPLDKF